MSAGGISQSVKSQSNLKGDNVVQVVGTIIDYDLKYNYDRDTGNTYSSYYAIYEYKVNGVRHTYRSHIGTDNPDNIGHTTTIYYNLDTKTAGIPSENTSMIGFCVFLLIVLVCMFGSPLIVSKILYKEAKHNAELQLERHAKNDTEHDENFDY